MSTAMEARIHKVNQVMEGFLSDFAPLGLVAPRHEVGRDKLRALTQTLAGITSLLAVIEPQGNESDGGELKTGAHRQNLDRLQADIRKLQPALEDRLHWITRKLDATHTAHSWPELLKHL